MNARIAGIGAVLALLLPACQQPDDQETGSISRERVIESRESLDPALVAALDSGNAAYRDQEYEAALRHYQQATEMDDEVAAAWFGVYMAHLALGDVEAANDAMDRARAIAPEASLLHPERDTTP